MSDIIPIDSEITTFSDYLDRNCRCILSARFGDGKSFFLNEFKKKTFNKYIFLTIYLSIIRLLKIKTSLSISNEIYFCKS